jgi:uncharacterized metal-binding protein YceD (DUF177 family)
MIAPPEFSRPARLDSLGEGDRQIAIAAKAGERAALARRFGLVAIDRLDAEGVARRAGAIVHFSGRLRADVVQTCVATDDPLPASIDTPFTLRFVPDDIAAPAHDEVELSEEDCDTVAYSGEAVDLGEAVAETLALSLDPFPRSAHADAVLRAAGVRSEGEVEPPAGPFAALKGLMKE